MESDGSLRMTVDVQVGAAAHLMVGSAQGCLDAARQAALQALAGLHGARPGFGPGLVRPQPGGCCSKTSPGSAGWLCARCWAPMCPCLAGMSPVSSPLTPAAPRRSSTSTFRWSFSASERKPTAVMPFDLHLDYLAHA